MSLKSLLMPTPRLAAGRPPTGGRRRQPSRRPIFIAITTFMSVLLPGSGQGQQQRPVFREAVNAIIVDVFPQRDGRIVEGLTRDDFAVYEDGRLQAIETFEFVRIEPAPADFVARDPNSQREMLEQAVEPQSRLFAVFLDTLHTSVTGSHGIRKPLVDLFDRQVAPGDLFGVITQNQRARDLVLGRVWDSVEAQLRRSWDWGQRHSLIDIGDGMLTGLDPADPIEQALDYCFSVKIVGGIAMPWYIEDGAARRLFSEVLIDRRREDRVLASLEELVPYVGALREPRTTLMVVTDGWLLFPPDNDLAEHIADTEVHAAGAPQMRVAPTGRLTTRDPLDPIGMDRNTCNQEAVRLAGLDNPRRLRELITVANRENVSIYPVNPEGIAVADAPMSVRTQPNPRAGRGQTLDARDRARLRSRVEGLQTLAANTDAFAVVNTNDVASGIRRILDDVSAYYLLGYYSPTAEPDGRYHAIRVEVKQPGVHVRARRGYRIPAPADPLPSAPEAAAIDPGTAAVDEAFARLGTIRSGVPVLVAGTLAGSQAIVSIELSPEVAASATNGADVTITIAARDGLPPVSASGRIEPGTRGTLVRLPIDTAVSGDVRAAVSVIAGRERLQDSVTLMRPDSALLGDAIVFRATPSPRSPLIPAVDRRFRRTERVHVEWPRLAELDRREARLLGRNGEPLAVPVSLAEREVDGMATISADVNLAPLTDGEYVIELVVAERGEATERKVIAIRVSR